MTPILLLGAGRMGGAMLAGWKRASAFSPDQLMIRDPAPSAEVLASGALIDPDAAAMGRAATVVLVVKPQIWREAAAQVDGPDISVVLGNGGMFATAGVLVLGRQAR